MYSLQLSRFLHIQSLFLKRSLSSPHGGSEVRRFELLHPSLTSRPLEQAVQAHFPFSLPFTLTPCTSFCPLLLCNIYSARSLMTFPSPDRIDSSCTLSFHKYLLGFRCSSCSGSIRKKKKIKTPAACSRHRSARLTGPPGARTPSAALLPWLLGPFCFLLPL